MSDIEFFKTLTWNKITKNKKKDAALKVNDECFKKIDDDCINEIMKKIIVISNGLAQSKFTLEEYITNTVKNSENLALVDKYILTYILINNKYNLTPSLINNFVQQNFHFTLINWLCQEKDNLKIPRNFSNNFQIFIYFLTNSVLFFRFLFISPLDLEKFKFPYKLYSIKEFLFDYLESNNVFLLNSIDDLLRLWESQTMNYNFQKDLLNFLEMNDFLGKKTKSPIKNIEDDKEDEKLETLGDTETKDEAMKKSDYSNNSNEFCEIPEFLSP